MRNELPRVYPPLAHPIHASSAAPGKRGTPQTMGVFLHQNGRRGCLLRPPSSFGRHVLRPISREAQTVNKRRFAIGIGDDVAVLPCPLTRNAAAGCATSIVIHRFPPGRDTGVALVESERG